MGNIQTSKYLSEPCISCSEHGSLRDKRKHYLYLYSLKYTQALVCTVLQIFNIFLSQFIFSLSPRFSQNWSCYKKNSFYNKHVIIYSLFIFVQPFKQLHPNTRNSFFQLSTCQSHFYVAHAILMGCDVQCTFASSFIPVKVKFCKVLCTKNMEPRMKT